MKYTLSIGAIFRMENSWLDEWIRYHHALGVEHFYLVNDDEYTQVSDRILQPYAARGLVENLHAEAFLGEDYGDRRCRQVNAYRKIIHEKKGESEWIAFIDLDEFILPRQVTDIREVLEDYRDHNGLAVSWALFGSSGHILRPPTQINHFLHRGALDWEWNGFVKSIVRPQRVVAGYGDDHHYFLTRNGDTVNENHEPVRQMWHPHSSEKIRVNHYAIRSWQDFWEVKAPRPRFNGMPPCDENHFRNHDRNEIFDDEIARRFGSLI